MGEANFNLPTEHTQPPTQNDAKETAPYVFEDIVGNGLQAVDRLLRKNELENANNVKKELLKIQKELAAIADSLNKRQKEFKEKLDDILLQTSPITQEDIEKLKNSYEKAKTDEITSRSFLG